MRALTALGQQELDVENVQATLGSVLKYHEDLLAIRDEALAGLVGTVRAPADAVVRHVVVFGRVLREGGLEVGPRRISDALHGLDAVDLARQEDVYWTLRQTLVSRREDLDTFDRAFDAWFLRVADRRGSARGGAATARRRAPEGRRARPGPGARRRRDRSRRLERRRAASNDATSRPCLPRSSRAPAA